MHCSRLARTVLFFFNDTATTEIYTLSLHDALPISPPASRAHRHHVHQYDHHQRFQQRADEFLHLQRRRRRCRNSSRSEEHTSELQSRLHLVCRLLLEKKKTTRTRNLSRSIPAPWTT